MKCVLHCGVGFAGTEHSIEQLTPGTLDQVITQARRREHQRGTLEWSAILRQGSPVPAQFAAPVAIENDQTKRREGGGVKPVRQSGGLLGVIAVQQERDDRAATQSRAEFVSMEAHARIHIQNGKAQARVVHGNPGPTRLRIRRQHCYALAELANHRWGRNRA